MIGARLPRVEDGPPVTGRGRFAADIDDAVGLLGAVTRPPVTPERMREILRDAGGRGR